ncbi:MAG: GNAT family N-acetyltransferase [Chloroflexi bacterium]|jgi:GNAT superfamily N-acetyltransferase|nr:GNAT family N-acetyltransferase [Chloroflexota bacterium]
MNRRPAQYEQDAETLLEMHRQSWRINFPGRRFDSWVFTASLKVSAGRGEVYVYEENGEIVAWLWLSFPTRATAHVRHVQVAEGHWGRGLGRQVMHDAISLARARGCHTLTLAVTKSNARAMALYRSLTFVIDHDEGERQRMRLDLTCSRLLPDEALREDN